MNQLISYTIMHAPLGRLLVGATARGICAVRWGESSDGLAAELSRDYPDAQLERDDERLRRLVAPLLDDDARRDRSLDLPLDVPATAFQRRVWETVRRIPAGETRSYGAVAAAAGHPGAARAVARACAANPAALVIPCHRVVRGDGSMGGYRWGRERKRQLLEREASNRAA
jgi:AraC family transcriptional regulator of adaptative response/methylated-DNA-[protein]-cysteine methyltransferase